MNYVGKIIYDNYCNGFFGRRYDLDGSKIIAEGDDWIVIRIPSTGQPIIAWFNNGWRVRDMDKLIEEWTNES